MHDGMQYDPTQGQCKGHEPLKLEIWPFLKQVYLLRHLQGELATDH